jgi:hypothetical protein
VRPYARGNLLYLVMKDEDGLQAVHIYEAQLAAGRQ